MKANIGHLEGASALASVVKCICTFQHVEESIRQSVTMVTVILEKGIIPPNALFEKINPAIDVDFYHSEVCQKISKPQQSSINLEAF